MTFHLWRLGYGVVLGTLLLAGSSLAVDRAATNDRAQNGGDTRFAAPAAPVASIRPEQNRPAANSSNSAAVKVLGQDRIQPGVWDAVEDQIRGRTSGPASPLADGLSRLRVPTTPGDKSSPSAAESAVDDKEAAGENDAPGNNDSAISAELVALRGEIRRVLAHYRTRQLNTRDHTPWEAMHGIIAFNVATEVRRDGPNGPPVNAIGWMLWSGRCRGQQMLTLQRGRLHAEEGVGVQGHPAQFLAILAQSGVSAKTPLRIAGKDFTLSDLIEEEMLDCRSDTELTFKLISFAHYLPSDATWRSRDGQAWSIPRLIKAEIKAPIRGAACGGAHRLFGISYAYQMREKEGQPVDGEFLRAKQYIASYHRYAWSLQNSDGSFSTEWFARRGNQPDIDRKLQTSGHILEWLVSSLSDEQLRDARTVKAVEFVATSLGNEPNRAWSIGPMGHALHALVMYDQRVFQRAAEPPSTLADVRSSLDLDNAVDQRPAPSE